MAASAFHREPEEQGPEGGGLVVGIHHAVFLIDDAALDGIAVVAQKSGGDQLPGRGVFQEIARQLFEDEPVIGHVGPVGLDDPIPPRPHGAGVVELEAVAVGVAGVV